MFKKHAVSKRCGWSVSVAESFHPRAPHAAFAGPSMPPPMHDGGYNTAADAGVCGSRRSEGVTWRTGARAGGEGVRAAAQTVVHRARPARVCQPTC